MTRPSDLPAWARALDARTDPEAAEPALLARLPSTPRTAQAWLTQAGLPELGERPLGELAPYTEQALHRWRTLTVLEALEDREAGARAAYAVLDARRAWLHALRQADRAPATPEPPPWAAALRALDPILDVLFDEAPLGWLVQPTDWRATPARCRALPGGAGFELRALDAPPHGLDPQDRAAVDARDPLARLRALIGHPRVFVRSPGAPIPVRGGELGLRVSRAGERLVLGLGVEGLALPTPGMGEAGDLAALLEGPDGPELRVLTVGRRAGPIAAWLAEFGDLNLPVSQAALLRARLPALDRAVPVHVEPGALGERVEGDPRPRLQLTRAAGEVLAELVVCPAPGLPPCPPGAGDRVRVLDRAEGAALVHRDLPAEARAAVARWAALGWGAGPVHLTEPQALDLVEQDPHLEPLWVGEPLRSVGRPLGLADLGLTVRAEAAGFTLTGSLQAEGQRGPLRPVLEAAWAGQDRVPLGPDRWARPDPTLRAALQALAGLAPPEGPIPLPAVHAHRLHALETAGLTLRAPAPWRALSERLAQAATLDPHVPAGLVGALRPYQRAGFTWLARLAHWAPGACLADDMGLGKTVQAIALLLHRRQQPALVVAPTSVLHGWARELARFAPELQVCLYHGPDRALPPPAPDQVVLTSWGLLMAEADRLGSLAFGTAVLDEAQALKDPSSRRAQAAYGLQAGFRLALSGTPLENRVEELLALLDFAVPGLVGPALRARLVRSSPADLPPLLAEPLAPFVLRRTKQQVGAELPARTEVVLRVDLSPAERERYAQGQQAAADRLARGPDRRSLALRELLGLRRLAHLPDPAAPGGSSKERAAVRVALDLHRAGHRCLVFSAFTEHLSRIGAALTGAGLRALTLRGAMSLAQRQAQIDAFQAGEADVFLIALKAGGLGLNLTAADHVLHLDPWWNPAAEDQASGRAHRLGQDRPVTVIRLVAAGTVEERVLALQERKRALAEAVLGGGPRAAVGGDPLRELLDEPFFR